MHRRKIYVKYELKNKLFKSILKNRTVPLANRYAASYRRSTLPRKSSITKLVNRCIQTGRQYTVIHKVRLSRFPFRVQSYNGVLPGVRRHS
jgi:ribosomal protein S14